MKKFKLNSFEKFVIGHKKVLIQFFSTILQDLRTAKRRFTTQVKQLNSETRLCLNTAKQRNI